MEHKNVTSIYAAIIGYSVSCLTPIFRNYCLIVFWSRAVRMLDDRSLDVAGLEQVASFQASIRGFRLIETLIDVWLRAVATSTIRLRLDGRSTAYQRSLRSQWRHPLAAVSLTYLFIF